MQGPPLSSLPCDMGALCLPRRSVYMQALVDDAVKKGARLAAGGVAVSEKEHGGQFYPPTLLLGVTLEMRVMQEEVFGPIMAVVRVDSDDVAVQMANDSAFGLGCSVFSKSIRRAEGIAARVDSGMASINDFGATYMCQVRVGRLGAGGWGNARASFEWRWVRSLCRLGGGGRADSVNSEAWKG